MLNPKTTSTRNLTTCPVCRGSGIRPGTQSKCLACKDTPGKVKADRVCPTCGHFWATCLCQRGQMNLVRRPLPEAVPLPATLTAPVVAAAAEHSAVTTPAPARRTHSGVIKQRTGYAVQIMRDGKKYYLGGFYPDERDLAVDLAAEARAADIEQFGTLKDKYQQRRKDRQGLNQVQYLYRGIEQAREKDDQYRALKKGKAEDLAVEDALQEAIEAWDEVARRLIALGHDSIAFVSSALGVMGGELEDRQS